MFVSFFKPKKSTVAVSPTQNNARIAVTWNDSGIAFQPTPITPQWLDIPAFFGVDAELVLLLRQWEEEGILHIHDQQAHLEWADFYAMLHSEDYANALTWMHLPNLEDWKPSLRSQGSLTDLNFAISIHEWTDPQGNCPRGNVSLMGGVLTTAGKTVLLPEATWKTLRSIAEHKALPIEQRTAQANRRAWATIRKNAKAANANLSDFLRKTVVLTPERLRIDLRKADVAGDRVVEVMPMFEDAPARWLELFDRMGGVPERYEIPDGENGQGLVHIMLSDDVRTVLGEIKRMPARRMAGERAEAFVRNPFSTLGEAANHVIDPAQFEVAREQAGMTFARFSENIQWDVNGIPVTVQLLIEEFIQGAIQTEMLVLATPSQLREFVTKLAMRIQNGVQSCFWKGFDLEITEDTPRVVSTLQAVLYAWETQEPVQVMPTLDSIFDLSLYSERIEGFGVEKPYYSPYIAKKDDGQGWFPENVDWGIFYTQDNGQTVRVALDDRNIESFRAAAALAQEEQREVFSFAGCPKPIPVKAAQDILDTVGRVQNDLHIGNFDPRKLKEKPEVRQGLVVKPNIDTLDYEERRAQLATNSQTAKIPRSLRSTVELKDHQCVGVAWLQQMWDNSPHACRGVLLADDMGLGKTLQLLTWMAGVVENTPSTELSPFLVIAPVSLLENWKSEIEKFFQPHTFRLLTLYGKDLADKRLRPSAYDAALKEAGSPKLLQDNWLDNANLVLTTYETLRDLEFSLAAQYWSAIVCDEAQKIKNPNALVTRAAKKQNARFKIACTGTPVENTLADLWCLFDFVQPGLLGTLSHFGRTYRRPIETETEEEKQRVVELRALFEPQTLRRTKTEVAKDLPEKREYEGCKNLRLSQQQRTLYAHAIASFKKKMVEEPEAKESILTLLHSVRKICSDPRPLGQISTSNEDISRILQESPKMAWLMTQLREIECTNEKAIVFCEFKDLQRTLQRCIGDKFGFTPDVINGDTSTNAAHDHNRQKRITAFQEKHGFSVIILSPIAVGFGVNIQAANHVIHFTRTWNPAKEDQATDRAYRIGQTKDVTVYYPVVTAPDFVTFDAKLNQLLDSKRKLSTDMLNGAGEISLDEFGDLEAPNGVNILENKLLKKADIQLLSPDVFEKFCAVLWSKQGYKTQKTVSVGDAGIDVIAIKGANGVLIQCKTSRSEGKALGWDAVKELKGGQAIYEKQHPNVKFDLLAVTTRAFNQTAKQRAKLNHVQMLEYSDLCDLLDKYPITNKDMQLL